MFKLSATELHQAFLKKTYSAEEIASYFLNRIQILNPQLQAFLSVFSDRILKQAKSLDRKRKENKPLGKLAGIPIALKDILHLKGELTTCGSQFLKNYRAIFNATVVELLEKEDALLIGKTNLDEFAMGSSTEHSSFFPTKNPWALDCVPGGSSGGSAAAVSARLCSVALGTDTGGSIRQPAAFCGIVGFKPTYGRVSRYGLVSYCSSMDQIGPMTSCVKDAGLLMEVLGTFCPKDSTSLRLPKETYLENLPSSLEKVKIGVPWGFLENLHPDVSENFKKALKTLRDLKATLVEVDLSILKYSIPVYYILAPAEASTNLARFDGIRYGVRSPLAKTLDEIFDISRDVGFGPEVKKRIMLGTYVLSSGFKDAYYKKAQKVRTLIIQDYEKAFDFCDFIATPVTPRDAFPLNSIQNPLEMYQQDLFTISANLAGLPAISVPSGLSPDQKPLGLQLTGPQLHDVAVLRCAHAFEQVSPFRFALPPLCSKESS